jgi:hypothetical protein
MTLTINPYKKKNGEFMIYLNDHERKVSLGIGERVYTTKLTKGQKNLLNRYDEALHNYEIIQTDISFEKIYDDHMEYKINLAFDTKLLITNIATVGTIKTGTDGAYIIKGNQLYNLQNKKMTHN